MNKFFTQGCTFYIVWFTQVQTLTHLSAVEATEMWKKKQELHQQSALLLSPLVPCHVW